MEYNDFEITLIKENWIIENCLIKREIMIKNTKKPNDFRLVNHIQTLNWSDYLQPNQENGYNTLEQILILIQESICYNPYSPILVHCR